MWQEAANRLWNADAIEVVDLAETTPDAARDRITRAAVAKRVRVNAMTTVQIIALLRSLPRAEQMRCHIPPFGLAFFAGAAETGWLSICWKCNNIHGRAGEDLLFLQFDASSKPARQLLKLCQHAIAQPD